MEVGNMSLINKKAPALFAVMLAMNALSVGAQWIKGAPGARADAYTQKLIDANFLTRLNDLRLYIDEGVGTGVLSSESANALTAQLQRIHARIASYRSAGNLTNAQTTAILNAFGNLQAQLGDSMINPYGPVPANNPYGFGSLNSRSQLAGPCCSRNRYGNGGVNPSLNPFRGRYSGGPFS